jgi:prevent-host-death family protein
MKSYTITDLRKNIYKVVEETSQSHEPVHVYGKNGNAVLVGEDDWRAIQETLHLHSIPGMAESITKGLKTPIDEASDKLDW